MDQFASAFELLNSTALGNIALLIAAVVGVAGNWWIYKRKRKLRTKTLRQSLYAEIHSMRYPILQIHEQHDVVTMDPFDPQSFLIDSVYQASSDELGLLSDEEVSAVVDFYSTAISIQRIIGDDFQTPYEQVARRNLLQKLDKAMEELKDEGDLKEDYSEDDKFDTIKDADFSF